MPTIDISVRNRIATALRGQCIICGNSDYTIAFDLDDEWNSIENKVAVFVTTTHGETRHERILFTGNSCRVPVLRDINIVDIGIEAGNVRTTTPARIKCAACITDRAGIPQEPTPDIYTQIISKLDANSGVNCIDISVSKESISGKLISSVDFSSIKSFALMPEKCVLTASYEGLRFLLSAISPNADKIIFRCYEEEYDTHGSIAIAMPDRITTHSLTFDSAGIEYHFGDLIKKVEKICATSALKRTQGNAIYPSTVPEEPNVANYSVNLSPNLGATGYGAFATGYAVKHPKYGWGYFTNHASGKNSTAFGNNTTAAGDDQFVCGNGNAPDTDQNYMFIVGIGGEQNGFAVTRTGSIVLPTGSGNYMQASFTDDGTIVLQSTDGTVQHITECQTNRVTVVDASATDDTYPTAKAVYDAIQAAMADK